MFRKIKEYIKRVFKGKEANKCTLKITNSKRKVQDHHPLNSRSVSFNPEGLFSYKIPVSQMVSLQQVTGQNPLKTNKTRTQIPLQTYISRHQSHLQMQIKRRRVPLYIDNLNNSRTIFIKYTREVKIICTYYPTENKTLTLN